jgi:hypothetical protein
MGYKFFVTFVLDIEICEFEFRSGRLNWSNFDIRACFHTEIPTNPAVLAKPAVALVLSEDIYDSDRIFPKCTEVFGWAAI